MNLPGRATIYSRANQRARAAIRKAAFWICLVFAALMVVLTGLNIYWSYYEWDFYPVVLLLIFSLIASLLIHRGRVTAGAVFMIVGFETVLAAEPYFVLGRSTELAMYLAANSLGFVVNALLAGLFVRRFFVVIVTLFSSANLILLAALSGDRAVLNSAPYVVLALIACGSLVFVFHVLFSSALASAQAEERHAAALREQLLQAQKMEAIGRLAGGITHDFNNMLAAIMGQMEIVRRDKSLSPELQQRVGEVLRFADKAAALVRRLLIFSRGEKPESRVFELQAALADLEGMLRRLLGSQVQLAIRASPQAVAVRADPGQFEQVIMNLVVNARDAMPQGGRIDIEVGCEEPRAAASNPPLSAGRYAFVRVRDTGTGMSPEVRSRLFEPFFTTKPKEQGTGLGLSTVYAIITGAGGGIAVDSVPGQGSTFCVYLPQV